MGKHAAPKYTGTHRKVNRKVKIAATSGIAAVTVAFGALAAAPANASTVNWTQRTCSAFAAYQAHPSTAGFRALVTDSTYLPKSYLKADVGQWFADVSSPSPKAVKYAAKDPGYVSDDCQS